MKITRRSLWILTSGVLVGALILHQVIGQARQETIEKTRSNQSNLEILHSDVIAVLPTNIHESLGITGNIKSVNQALVKTRVSGEVREVMFREGEKVKKGQVMLRIEEAEYQALLEQARGAYLAAKGHLDIASKARENSQSLLGYGFVSQNNFDNSQSQYAIAEANVSSLRGALNVAEKSLRDTVVKAPISGLVSLRDIEPGEKISADNRLFEIVDLDTMELEATVPSSNIAKINVGQQVQVNVEGINDNFQGHVARINPATQPGSRSIMIYVKLDNTQGKMRSGMFANGKLIISDKKNILVVPQAALQTVGGKFFVYTIEKGVLRQQLVKLGIKGESSFGPAVEVISGINSGTHIVKTNLGVLPENSKIQLIEIASDRRIQK